MRFPWNEESENRLRDMWNAGATAEAIGAELGTTRSCVLGKKRRLGLSSRKGERAAKETPEERAERLRAHRAKWRANNPEKHRATQRAWDEKRRLQRASQRKDMLRLVAVGGRLLEPLYVPFMDLERGMCRFPFDRDDQQFYCGRPQEHGTSYCDDCCRVAFLNYEQVVSRAPAPLKTPQNGRVAGPYRDTPGVVHSLNTLIGDLSDGEMQSRFRGSLREVPFS